MKKNTLITQITIFVILIFGFIACDKDFATLDSDIISSDNAASFDIKDSLFNVIAYTKPLDPVQTNNIGLSQIGIYDDMAYGRTTGSFVTQISAESYDPSFGFEVGNEDNDDFIAIDSVILTIPYFSTITSIEDEVITYDIDSIFGNNPMKLRIFESNYFLRNFNPNSEFTESQAYFSNQSASASELIADDVLEVSGQELQFIPSEGTSYTEENQTILGDNVIEISSEGFILTKPDTEEDDDLNPQVTQRQAPGLRLKLEPNFWQTKIIEQEDQTVLSSANNFFEYFRGLYFKAEPVGGNGSYLILNTSSQNSNITIYYTRNTVSTTDEEDETEQASFVLNFGQNSANFIDNSDFEMTLANIEMNADPVNGDSRLYLKGGEGTIAKIKLFNGDDISDENSDMTFDEWKEFFVETDGDGNFVSSKRLINEANLVFYVDQNTVGNLGGDKDVEPNRIYIYDAVNNTPLLDYFLDGTRSSFPEVSISNHLGPLERDGDASTSTGVKYKFRITEHINNLLLRDSTNVELGLSISTNVNIEEQSPQRQVQTSDGTEFTVPISTVLSPRGTVLYGNNIPDNDIDAGKKVYLEIYYTDPQD